MIKLKSLLKSLLNEDVDKGIDSVLKKHFGWLSNKGQFYAVEFLGHLKYLNDLPLPPKTKELYNNKMEEIENEIKYREDSRTDGEEEQNLEWHVVEMMQDDLVSQVMKSIYTEGWIRIGLTKDKVYEFEGTPDSLKSKSMYISKFKNSLEPNFDIKLTPRKI